MTSSSKAVLLGSAMVLLLANGAAIAQMEGPPPPDGPMQGLMHRQGRLGDRLLGEFDSSHDGKVTHTEFNSVLAKHYADIVRGRPGMTLEMYAAVGLADFQRHTGEMFKRIDWQGNGKVTLDEWASPQRARFELMDTDGTGVVSCAPDGGLFQVAIERGPADDQTQGGRSRGAGSFGRTALCRDSDLNEDGKVTRAEFDLSLSKQFKLATKGAPTMTQGEFAADQLQRYRDTAARVFKRIDRDRDNLLSLAEFAAPMEKLFARLDRNGDGVISDDEMRPRVGDRTVASAGGHGTHGK